RVLGMRANLVFAPPSADGGGHAIAGVDRCVPPPIHCWQGSLIDRSVLPVVAFWLDIFAVTDAVSLAAFQPYNQALILEAGFNPRRAAQCAGASGGAERSLYVLESMSNPRVAERMTRKLQQ